jgi:hypothetical protein
LRKRRKSISLYVDQDDETDFRTDEMRKENDRFLARLTLDHLGLANKALFLLGYLSTLYVAVEPEHSSASSLKQ